MHIEIPADDTQTSQQFWGSLFGWQFQANPGPFEYHTAQIGEEQGAAITNMEPGKRGMRPYFAVGDIKAGAARVTELGGEANEPMPVPGMGWFSACKDRTGTSSGSGRPPHRPQPRDSRPVQQNGRACLSGRSRTLRDGHSGLATHAEPPIWRCPWSVGIVVHAVPNWAIRMSRFTT